MKLDIKKITFVLLLLMPLQVFCACKVVHKSSATNIRGAKWTLKMLNNQSVDCDSVEFRQYPYIQFLTTEEHFSGHTGCNAIGGTYQFLEKNRLRLYDIISTRMACLNQGEVEQNMLQALRAAHHYLIKGKTLTLYSAKNIPLAVFEIRETKKQK